MFCGGFGHVLPDGYRCCYYIRNNEAWIMVSCDVSGGHTDLDRFQNNLRNAFTQIGDLLGLHSEQQQQPKAGSKL